MVEVTELHQLCAQAPFDAALAESGFDDPDTLPFGAVIAIVDLTLILRCDGSALSSCSESEAAFGDFRAGRFMWELRNVRRLRRPLPTRGYQKVWNLSEPLSERALEWAA
jgi:hypothetical protein